MIYQYNLWLNSFQLIKTSDVVIKKIIKTSDVAFEHHCKGMISCKNNQGKDLEVGRIFECF